MNESENRPVSIGNWILTFILLAIPLVNLIMLIVWAASGSTHPSKKTFAVAYLILIGIIIVLSILAGVVLAVLGIAIGHHGVQST